jgi:hypothetical protein
MCEGSGRRTASFSAAGSANDQEAVIAAGRGDFADERGAGRGSAGREHGNVDDGDLRRHGSHLSRGIVCVARVIDGSNGSRVEPDTKFAVSAAHYAMHRCKAHALHCGVHAPATEAKRHEEIAG